MLYVVDLVRALGLYRARSKKTNYTLSSSSSRKIVTGLAFVSMLHGEPMNPELN